MRVWLRLREAFWFVPALLCVAAVVLAEAVLVVDRRVEVTDSLIAPLVYEAGASGSRDLLGAIAGSMLGVASTTFSITMAVLALTSSSYGPRLVRNFMGDRGNQLVLGTFLATFLYALVVLRSVRSGSDTGSGGSFVPHLAVNVAVVLAVLSIAVLVYFIHHISDSIQVATLSGRVRRELRETVDRLYPADAGLDRAETSQPSDSLPADVSGGTAVTPRSAGYVAGIDAEHLVELARRADVTVVMLARPGDHVLDDDVVARVWPPVDDDGTVNALSRAVTIGENRTPYQDITFAVQQLVELAVRALSPGTNDPFTAQNALDDLKVGLAQLAARPLPSARRYDTDGRLRLVAHPVALESLLDHVLDAVRTYALDAPSVLMKALELVEAVGARTSSDHVREHLSRHVGYLVDAYGRGDPVAPDLHRLRARADTVLAGLTGRSADGTDGAQRTRP